MIWLPLLLLHLATAPAPADPGKASVGPWALANPITPGRLAAPELTEPPVFDEPRRPDGKPLTCLARGVVDVETGQILYGRCLTQRMFPASTTKIMTTLLALESLEAGRARLDDVITISKPAAEVIESGLWMVPGEHLTLRDLLVGVMVRSANDAAYAVAEYLGGTPEAFVDRMNQRARELGCLDAHFVNPHGLHMGLHGEDVGDQHYLTAYDLLLITMAAWRFPLFRELCLMDGEPIGWENVDPGPKKKHPNRRIIHNRNKLLRSYFECIGVKTGSTRQAGACLVSAARRGDREVLAVALNCSSGGDRWMDSEALLRYGLDAFERRTILPAGQPVAAMRIRGSRRALPVVTTEGLTAVLPRQAPAPRARLEAASRLRAPIPAGLPVGWAMVDLPQGEQRRVTLVTSQDLPGLRRRVGLAPFALLLLLGLVSYGALAEAHCRGGALFASSRRGADPRGTGEGQRGRGA